MCFLNSAVKPVFSLDSSERLRGDLWFELVEYVFNDTVFVNQEAYAVQAIINFAHKFLGSQTPELFSNPMIFI